MKRSDDGVVNNMLNFIGILRYALGDREGSVRERISRMSPEEKEERRKNMVRYNLKELWDRNGKT